jgi:hypothetical protein
MPQHGNDLLVSVYLNQRIVFDLFAMHQDGLSEITRITTVDSAIGQDTKKYGASFGLNRALSALLKIDVSGERDLSKGTSSETHKSEERVHTPASIFYKLRNLLKAKDKICSFDNHYQPKSGDLVEFTADLRKNPIVQTMNAFVGLMNMVITFSDDSKKKGQIKNQADDHRKIKRQMEEFLESLKAGDTTDIVSDIIINNYRAVITLEHEFLNDPTMSDLVDGHFNIVGKIIRVIPDDKNSINLLRKAALSAMPKKNLAAMMEPLSDLQANEGFEIPTLQLEIQGPVIHVIPIAIFA